MVIVYHEVVGVTNRAMPVWMTVRFFSFPTLVFVIVMEPMGMHVLVDYLCVGVQQIHRIVAGPQPGRHGCRCQDTGAQGQCRGRHTELSTQLARNRVENQPAGVG